MTSILALLACGFLVGALSIVVSHTRGSRDIARTLAFALLGALIGGGFGALIGTRAQLVTAVLGAILFSARSRGPSSPRTRHA